LVQAESRAEPRGCGPAGAPVEHDSGGSYAAAERATGEDWEDHRYGEDVGDSEMFWAELEFFAGGSFSFGRSGM
jgi:hypothetical protein